MSIFTSEQPDTIFPRDPEDSKPKIQSKESEDLLSIQAAVLSDGDPLENYSQMQTLEEGEKGLQTQHTIDMARAEDERATNTLLLEESAKAESPDMQASLFNMIRKPDENTRSKRSSVLFAEKLMSMPSSDTEEEEEVRLSSAAVVEQIVDSMERKQKIYNSELINSESGWHTFLDFLEYLVPADEQMFLGSVISKLREAQDVSGRFEALFAMGESKIDLQKMYQSMNPDQQEEFEKRLLAVVAESRGIIFTNDNDMMQQDLIKSIIEPGHYEGGLRTLDNIVSVLDAIGMGAFLGLGKMASRVDIAKIRRAMARSEVQPHSAAKVAESTNPSQARAITQTAIADETGEVAKATHAASREEVVADAHAPAVNNGDGSTTASPNIPDHLPEEIEKILSDTGVEYSVQEKFDAQTAMAAEFDEVGHGEAMVYRKRDSFIGRNEDGSIEFSGIYGKENTGFKSAEEALDIVTGNFRFYDTTDSNFVLMQKQKDGSIIEVSLDEVKAKQELRQAFVNKKKKLPEELKRENFIEEFYVRADFKRDFDPTKVKHEDLSYTKNWLDRFAALVPNRQGKASWTRYLFDPASIFDKRVFSSASVAVERSAAVDTMLLKIADGFVKPFQKLSKSQQGLAFDLFKKQNVTGKRLTRGELQAAGFRTEEELQVFDKWAEVWDTVYLLENQDLAKSLQAKGYQTFHAGENQLVARPVNSKRTGTIGNDAKILDGETGNVITLTKDEIDEIYEAGGSLGELKMPHAVDGTDVQYVINRNTSTSYAKEITKNTRVLNYREGYFSVRYDDPYFLVKRTTDKNGKVTSTQAVKTAHSKAAASRLEKELMRGNTEEGVDYYYRTNRDIAESEVEDMAWSLAVNSGRTSQRLRGERIGSTTDEAMGSIVDPVDSLIAATRNIAKRTSARDWLDKMKLRFQDEFSDFMQMENGMMLFPKSPADLVAKEGGEVNASRLADARTMLEYINYMEYGYKNLIDNSWRSILNGIADNIGLKSEKAELGIRAVSNELNSPTGLVKGRAFDLYIATNPLRQILVQGHQGTILAANFPKYVLSQQLARDMAAVHAGLIFGDKLTKFTGTKKASLEKFFGMSLEDAVKLTEEYRATGFEAGIDRHNLVEGGLNQLVESSNFKGTKKLHKATVGNLRKMGFDVGERFNIMSSWLAHRNQALERLSKPLTSEGGIVTIPGTKELPSNIRAEVIAAARNYTFNMNAAGDMPYNKSSMSVVFQFMQVPHKALLTMTSNRLMSKKEKARMAAYSVASLSVPTTLAYTIANSLGGLPEDELARDLVINGIEGTLINESARLIYGDDTMMDFSSLSAFDPMGIYETIHQLFSGNLNDILSATPSLSLVMGHNPRLGSIVDEVKYLMTEPTAENLNHSIKAFLNSSSGYRNFSKGYQELFEMEIRTRMSRGAPIDKAVTVSESFGKILGIPSVEESLGYMIKRKSYLDSQAAIDDAVEMAKVYHGIVTRRGIDVNNPEYQKKMQELFDEQKAFFIVSEFTPKQQKAFHAEIAKNVSKGDASIYRHIIRAAGLLPLEDITTQLHNGGFHEEAKGLTEMQETIKQAAEESRL
jgi:hypothetical protein